VALNTDDARAPYLQLADHLRRQIESGALAPGAKLPTVEELATEWDLSPGTVQRSLDALRPDGLISGVQGKGTFVRSDYKPDPNAQSGGDLSQQVAELSDELSKVKKRLTRLERRAQESD
jgi:GntR family transcriptional regulator